MPKPLYTLLGENDNLDYIPVFCPTCLGRNEIKAIEETVQEIKEACQTKSC